MTAQFSIGEQVVQMVDGIGAFYSLPQSTPLTNLIETRTFETRQRLTHLRPKPSQAKPSQAKKESASPSESRGLEPKKKKAWNAIILR
ncbi:MAG: hypothetical protein HQL45_14035 [Alphaproteobacteria bacterium]|nr:hypothetical protein [Alphaproteobacteria bacterium]